MSNQYTIFDAIKDTVINTNDCWSTEASAKARARMCDSCEHKTKMRQCSLCGCFLPLKVKYKDATCPIGKWENL